MFQVDFGTKDDPTDVRVVVVETRKELHQIIQSIAWVSGDKTMYHPHKDIRAAVLDIFGQTTVVFSRADLTWEIITHEASHVAQLRAGDDQEELAIHTGQLTTSIAKELKAHGYKILL